MVLGGISGVINGFFAFGLANLVFPPYAVLGAAFAGAIFILLMGLGTVPHMREMLPMALVGWGSFLAAIARYDYLFTEKVVWANTKALQTFFGVLLSVLIGLLLGALVATPLMKGENLRAIHRPEG
jgi:hypothetical protein